MKLYVYRYKLEQNIILMFLYFISSITNIYIYLKNNTLIINYPLVFEINLKKIKVR